jgi:hypothetical protein
MSPVTDGLVKGGEGAYKKGRRGHQGHTREGAPGAHKGGGTKGRGHEEYKRKGAPGAQKVCIIITMQIIRYAVS